MKKLFTLMLICVMVMCSACGSGDSKPDADSTTQTPADTTTPVNTQTPADTTTPVDTQAPADTTTPVDTQAPADETTPTPVSELTPMPTDEPSDIVPDDTTDFDPDGDIAPEFCAVWKYTDDTESDNFVGIYYGNTFVIVDNETYIEGTVKPVSPSEILLVGNDGTEIMSLTMSSMGTLQTTDGRSLFYYLDVVDERVNDDAVSDNPFYMAYAAALMADDEELLNYFVNNCFYSVDSEFDADVMRTVYPFIGRWMLSYEGDYFIDETFAYRGIMIYADNAWTWVNAYGIPAMTPGQVISADQSSVTLYDAGSDSVFTLTVDSEGALVADNGDTYNIVSGTEIEYPLQGAPIEVIGKWTGDEGLGGFLIDRTGMVVFDEAPEYTASVSTLSRDTIAFTIGDESTEISIYEAPAGILVDSLGTVYYKAE